MDSIDDGNRERHNIQNCIGISTVGQWNFRPKNRLFSVSAFDHCSLRNFKVRKFKLAICYNVTIACVAGVRKGKGKELGREAVHEEGGRRERLQASHCFSHPAY